MILKGWHSVFLLIAEEDRLLVDLRAQLLVIELVVENVFLCDLCAFIYHGKRVHELISFCEVELVLVLLENHVFLLSCISVHLCVFIDQPEIV